MSTGNNNNTGKVRRCLICRKPGQSLIRPVSLNLPEFQQDLNKLQNIWSQSCISSVCSLLNIQKSPFKHFITNATYCQDCQQLLRDIDLAQKQLKNFQQQLIGFQQDIYLKLGDNYDAVPSKDKLEANYKDLESPSKIYKRQFSYDEVVKMLYESKYSHQSLYFIVLISIVGRSCKILYFYRNRQGIPHTEGNCSQNP